MNSVKDNMLEVIIITIMVILFVCRTAYVNSEHDKALRRGQEAIEKQQIKNRQYFQSGRNNPQQDHKEYNK